MCFCVEYGCVRVYGSVFFIVERVFVGLRLYREFVRV